MPVLFRILFPIVFVVVFVMFFVILFQNLYRWNKNNQAPRLTVDASVVTKRSSHHHEHASSYYATFQVASGDRMELSLSGTDFGMLAEGDFGKLTFQGTRFLGFERGGESL